MTMKFWKVVCRKCGWSGRRSVEAEPCPKCAHWHPVSAALLRRTPKSAHQRRLR